MTVRKYLDVCTSHISETTADELGKVTLTSNLYHGLVVYPFEYGWFVHVEGVNASAMPGDLLSIVFKAQQNECTFIKLDRDGDDHDDLQTYDW